MVVSEKIKNQSKNVSDCLEKVMKAKSSSSNNAAAMVAKTSQQEIEKSQKPLEIHNRDLKKSSVKDPTRNNFVTEIFGVISILKFLFDCGVGFFMLRN